MIYSALPHNTWYSYMTLFLAADAWSTCTSGMPNVHYSELKFDRFRICLRISVKWMTGWNQCWISPHLASAPDGWNDIDSIDCGCNTGKNYRIRLHMCIYNYLHIHTCYIFKYIYQRKLGSNLPSYGQIELWDSTQWMVVWEFTSHHNEKCQTIFNEWWCESWHHTTMRSVRLNSMNGGVRVDITSRWEVWDYLNEWWCESWHRITRRSVRLYSMNGGVWVDTLAADRSMIVVVMCCHVRREMRVWILTLQDAL